MNARKPTKEAKRQAVTDDLTEARAVLQKYTNAGRLSEALRPRSLKPEVIADPFGFDAHVIEFAAKRCASDLGCWLRSAMERGAGVCTPAPWAGEGRHLLVLDSQAVAEMHERLAIFDCNQDAFRQLQELRGKGRA